jgi:hypothetical protein
LLSYCRGQAARAVHRRRPVKGASERARPWPEAVSGLEAALDAMYPGRLAGPGQKEAPA